MIGRMPKWLEKIELFIDRSIPIMLVLLTIMIVLEFTHWAEIDKDVLHRFDYFIVTFFVIDLCFKWHHTKNIVKFMKLYWIDVLAVFPFYLIFRFYYAAREVLVAGEQVQKILHETVLVREARLLKEAELATKVAKEGRFVRVFTRSLRLLRARWYIIHGHFQDISKGYKEEHKH